MRSGLKSATNVVVLCLVLGTIAFFSVGCSDDDGGDPLPPAAGEDSGSGESAPEGDDPSGPAAGDIGDNDPTLLIAIGDSITAGSETPGPGYPERLAGILGKTVRNNGRPGAFSSSAGGHAASALSSKPAYLLIMYGSNDVIQEVSPSAVAGNLRAAVQAAKANMTIPVVASIPPVKRSSFLEDHSRSVNNAIRSMASSEGAIFVNVAGQFGDTGLYTEDLFHPNDTGNQAIAFAFADRLR